MADATITIDVQVSGAAEATGMLQGLADAASGAGLAAGGFSEPIAVDFASNVGEVAQGVAALGAAIQMVNGLPRLGVDFPSNAVAVLGTVTELAGAAHSAAGTYTIVFNIETHGSIPSVGASISGHAVGDPFFEGGYTWVGEHGPELVRLPRAAMIMPAGRSEQVAGESASGAGGGTLPTSTPITIHNTITLDGTEVGRQTIEGTLEALQARGVIQGGQL
jgi:hypothetical protein